MDEEDIFLEDNGNFITYLLDNINYNIFKCFNLLSSFDNLKNNYSFYTISGLFVIILGLNFTFIFYSIPSLRYSLLKRFIRKEELLKNITRETKRQITMNNPPLNKKKTSLKPNLKTLRTRNSKKKPPTLNIRINSVINISTVEKIGTQAKNDKKCSSTSNLIPNNRIEMNNEELNELPYSNNFR